MCVFLVHCLTHCSSTESGPSPLAVCPPADSQMNHTKALMGGNGGKKKKKKHPSLHSHNPQMYCTVRLSWNLIVSLGWVSVWRPELLWSKTSSVCISYRQRLHSPVDLNLQSINNCLSSVYVNLVINTGKEAGPCMKYIWIDTSTVFSLNCCLNLYVTSDVFDFSKEGLSCMIRLQSWPSERFGLARQMFLAKITYK